MLECTVYPPSPGIFSGGAYGNRAPPELCGTSSALPERSGVPVVVRLAGSQHPENRLLCKRFFVGELITFYVCASKLGEQQNEGREQHDSGSNPECDG